MQYIALDSHKHYSQVAVEDQGRVGLVEERRIEHRRGGVREYLERWERGSPVAVETVGNWYWIVEEIEAAGMEPRLVHAGKAKLLMGMANKTDKLDARGLNRLQRSGSLPVVWIPPGPLRDLRELMRTRMALVRQRTQIKNRLQATLSKYALEIRGLSDVFGKKGRVIFKQRVAMLPPQTRFASERCLDQLDSLHEEIRALEGRLKEVIERDESMKLLESIPGVGPILAAVIALEVGEVGRFPSAGHLASYAGTTPRVHSSGGKTRYGRLRSDVNHYLKWAFVEAANVCARLRSRYPGRHVSLLYQRIAPRRGHQKAIGALARHLAEASYWILTKKEPYREPKRSHGFVEGNVNAD